MTRTATGMEREPAMETEMEMGMGMGMGMGMEMEMETATATAVRRVSSDVRASRMGPAWTHNSASTEPASPVREARAGGSQRVGESRRAARNRCMPPVTSRGAGSSEAW
jgi:hypothetical protein